MPLRKLEAVLSIPDVHVPYHHRRAWALMLKVAHDLKPKHLHCIGDLCDFYTVSSHSKSPNRALKLDAELREVGKALDQLDALGAANKQFIAGNHCDRMTRYLQDKAPELFNIVGIPELLKLKERGWSYTPYKRDTKLGKVHLTHDVGSAGRNAIYKALDTYGHSVITGHTHRFQYIVEGNALGQSKLSASFGWLGDVNAVDYMHNTTARKNWQLGFGVGYLDTKTGIVYMVPVPIIKVGAVYTCMVNGKYYEG